MRVVAVWRAIALVMVFSLVAACSGGAQPSPTTAAKAEPKNETKPAAPAAKSAESPAAALAAPAAKPAESPVAAAAAHRM